jgi:hypothetical protein
LHESIQNPAPWQPSSSGRDFQYPHSRPSTCCILAWHRTKDVVSGEVSESDHCPANWRWDGSNLWPIRGWRRCECIPGCLASTFPEIALHAENDFRGLPAWIFLDSALNELGNSSAERVRKQRLGPDSSYGICLVCFLLDANRLNGCLRPLARRIPSTAMKKGFGWPRGTRSSSYRQRSWNQSCRSVDLSCERTRREWLSSRSFGHLVRMSGGLRRLGDQSITSWLFIWYCLWVNIGWMIMAANEHACAQGRLDLARTH